MIYDRLPPSIREQIDAKTTEGQDRWLHVYDNDLEYLQHIEGRFVAEEEPESVRRRKHMTVHHLPAHFQALVDS